MKQVVRVQRFTPQTGEFEIEVPAMAQILTVDEQHGMLAVWYLRDIEDDPKTKTKINLTVSMTGQEFELGINRRYINTVFFNQKSFVLHVFQTN